MDLRSWATVALITLAIPLLSVPPVRARETIAITGEDQPLDAGFEEVFRVGVVEGESRGMLDTVCTVAFDARGNLYLSKVPGSRRNALPCRGENPNRNPCTPA